MPRYKLTISFDVDRVPNFETAERIAKASARQFEDSFTYIVTPLSEPEATCITHLITNVESHKPGIITNHDD